MGKQSCRPKDKGLCAYCGAQPWTTCDHVIPKSLFPRPLPTILVTVGTCLECNQAKAPLDDYIRDMLLADIDSSRSPAARAVRDGAMLESFRSNRSVLAREAASSLRIEPMYTPSGLYLGHFPAFKCNGDWTRSAFTYVVRGLYHIILKKRIPDDYKFDVARVDRFHAAREFREAVQLQPGHYRRLGEGVFDCTFFYAEEDRFASYWLLVFYNSILITVATEPPKIWPRP